MFQFAGIKAEQGAEGAIAVTETAVAVRKSDADRCVLDGIAKQR